jgi:hypothetical protein
MEAIMIRTVLCIKWGMKYGYDYVNRLYGSVCRNLDGPFRFVCLTDNARKIHPGVEIRPLPVTPFDEDEFDSRKGGETWRKVGLFQPGLAGLKGDTLFLDLDVVITGPLDRFFEYKPGSFCVIQDWLEHRRRWLPGRDGRVGNTSVFRFNPKRHCVAYERFAADQLKVLNSFRIEQQYISDALDHDMFFWPSEWVRSFKRSCRPYFPLNHFVTPYQPENMSVLAFHGYPLPDQAIDGYRGGLIKTTLPAPWLEAHWSSDTGSQATYRKAA